MGVGLGNGIARVKLKDFLKLGLTEEFIQRNLRLAPVLGFETLVERIEPARFRVRLDPSVEVRLAPTVDPLAQRLEFFRRQLRNRRFDFFDLRHAYILSCCSKISRTKHGI